MICSVYNATKAKENQRSGLLLYIDGRAAGVIEIKQADTTLIGVGSQADRYTRGLPR